MSIEVQAISRFEFDGRNQVVDERFSRDRERIENLEEVSMQMVKLSTQLTEIIKADHSRIECMSNDVNDLKSVSAQLNVVVQDLKKNDEDKNKRLTKIENKPSEKYDKIIGYLLSAAVGAIVVYFFNLLIKSGGNL